MSHHTMRCMNIIWWLCVACQKDFVEKRVRFRCHCHLGLRKRLLLTPRGSKYSQGSQEEGSLITEGSDHVEEGEDGIVVTDEPPPFLSLWQ